MIGKKLKRSTRPKAKRKTKRPQGAAGHRKGSPKAPKLMSVPAQAGILASLRQGWSVTRACEQAQIARVTYYRQYDHDPEFAKLCDDAINAGTDILEDEVMRRAREGIDKPIFYKGDRVDVIKEYSDTLAIALLNARRPEKFKWRGDITSNGKELKSSIADAIRDAATVTPEAAK